LSEEDPCGGVQYRVGGYCRGARCCDRLLPHEPEADPVGGHDCRQRHPGEGACGARVFSRGHVDICIPGERVEDERHVRHATFAHLLFRDDGAVAVGVDLSAEQIGHRFSQSRGTGQHEFAELGDVRIRRCAAPVVDGMGCRAHIPKP
jgi:hypothetical protein